MAKETQNTDSMEGEESTFASDSDPVFPSIGAPDPEEDGEKGSEGEDTVAARLAQLEEQREEDRRMFAEERKHWQSTVDRLLQGQAAPSGQASQGGQAPEPPKSPEVDFSGLPDPVDKPAEYQAELSRRMNSAMQQQVSLTEQRVRAAQEQTQQQQNVYQQLDNMWEQFKTKYQDLADKQITLKGSVSAEIEGMRQRGVDPTQGMMADPDGFMERVASRMRKELGEPDQGQSGSEGEAGNTPPNRTKGLGNGTKVNGMSGKGGKKPPGFLDQLKKVQLDSGLI